MITVGTLVCSLVIFRIALPVEERKLPLKQVIN